MNYKEYIANEHGYSHKLLSWPMAMNNKDFVSFFELKSLSFIYNYNNNLQVMKGYSWR